MTAELALAPSPEPAWWTLYPTAEDAAAHLGHRVAHLAGGEPVSIGHPADTSGAVQNVWVRYQDPDGATYGVATLPHPETYLTGTDDTALAITVGTVIRHAGHIHGVFGPDDTAEPPRCALRIDGTAHPAAVFGAAPGVYVRAARTPDGTVIAVWGPERVLEREITLTA